ncbi:MAG: acyl-CoA dehydrogenase family protein [Aestuariibacter sp.]
MIDNTAHLIKTSTTLNIEQDNSAIDAVMTDENPLLTVLDQIGANIASEGAKSDMEDTLSQHTYNLLKEHQVFSAMVPKEYGGLGVGYQEMCEFLTALAQYHPSTALSLSMHQHIIAANRFNDLNGKSAKALLSKVSAKQLVLISTGAGDWLASSGDMTKVDGGYLFNGVKHFCSGSTGGDVFVTSGPYLDPEHGWQVLHFPVPVNSDGVTILDNWRPMGMRGTGSNSVKMENVFVPEESVALKRPRGEFHAMWNVVGPVALPIIMSVYLGVAKKMTEMAISHSQKSLDPVTPYLVGEMENALTIAEVAHKDMIAIVDEFNFTPSMATLNEIAKRKTIVSKACKDTATKAIEVCGGQGYSRDFGLEALFRDSFAAQFHPMQEKRQHLFTGSIAMGKEPPTPTF